MRALLSPRMLLLHVVALAAVGAAGWLGVWQVSAWQDNRQDKAAALVDAEPIPLDQALGPDDVFPSRYVGQPVTLSGRWLPEQTAYVERDDTRWVVTPVATASGSAVLVVRGSTKGETQDWMEGAQRSTTITGWLQPGEGASGVRIVDFLERMDQDLYGGYVIAREPREAGLAAVTPDQLPKPGTFTSLRNLLYGLEWWVFGAFAAFLWWRWCRDDLDRVRSGMAAAEAGEDAGQAQVRSSP